MSIASIRALLERQQASIRLVDGKLALRGSATTLKDRDFVGLIQQHRAQILTLIAAGESFEYEDNAADNIPPNLLRPNTDVITPDLLPLLEISQEEIDHIVASVPGGAKAIQDIYPLTPLQEGMLFHYLMAEKSDPYLIWSIYTFDDQQTLDAYVETFNVVISRHDILRTCLRWDGLREPVQLVLRQTQVHIEHVDLDCADGDVVEQMKARFNPNHYRLDLRDAPLIKLLVARDEKNDRLVVMHLAHHLTTDRTTGDIITSEIMAIMSGKTSSLPDPVPYRNLVARVKSGLISGKHEEFFRELLSGVEQTTAPFGLLDVHRDGSQIVERSTVLDPRVSETLSTLARSKGISATSIVHVAWGYVLARLCNTDMPVFGTVMFGRVKTGGSNERILGVSINTLPVIVHADMPVIECAKNMQILLADLLHHEHAPLTVTQKAANLPNGIPLFTSVVNYRHSSSKDRPLLDAPAVAAEKVRFIAQHEGNNYPLTLSVDDYVSSFKLTIQAADGIDPELILSLTKTSITSVVDALENAPSRPLNELAVLTPEDESALVRLWRGEDVPTTDTRCIHHYVEEQVAATPDRIAVRAPGIAITYRELDRRANQIAHHLQQLGVTRGSVVGACLRRSIDQIATMVAIFKAGGTYLPLDPDYPPERLNYLMKDSGCGFVVTLSSHANLIAGDTHRIVALDQFEAAGPDKRPVPIERGPDDVAYLLYTSGSTGKPKGVVGLHRALTSRLLPERRLRNGTEVYGQKTSINFIDSFWEVFIPLTTGATIEVLSWETVQDPSELCRALNERGITHIVLVPTLLSAIVSHLQATSGALTSLQYCVCSGEPLSADLANRFKAVLPYVVLVNIYGTTEFWDATAHHVVAFEPGTGVPLGFPMSNIGVYILDERMRLVPPGVEGELYVTSPGIGPGYKGREDLTANVFLSCPFEPGKVMYRTGDRVRWRGDVGLEYRGRADRQINLHGFRIEPGEIEQALTEHPDVAEAVVLARKQGDDIRLAGYVVPAARDATVTIPFGLFYFSESGASTSTDEIGLYIESVKRADQLGFDAVWTPERHFTKVGAAFPNPSVLSAAAAMVTKHVQLRSGSVVLPLHDPLRVAEEWAVVDRLSGGRVELSFASGWVPNDFVLAPENFERRHAVMLKGVQEVQELWRGGSISRRNGVGAMVDIGIQPRPVQPELPVWITAAGAPKTFLDAGRLGANVLTHVLNTTISGLAEKISAYRRARQTAGFDPSTGKVAVMLHTYVREDAASAVAQARPCLETYFRSQLKLRKDVGDALGLDVQTDQDLSDEVIALAIDRYLTTKAIIGSPESCLAIVRELYDAGADEIACLIDFGLPGESIVAGLDSLNRLRQMSARTIRTSDLNTWLAAKLPPYMLPSSIMAIDSIPLTPNGKIDRLALPDPTAARSKPTYVAPCNETEVALAKIWADVLRLEKIGVGDSFFDLGGNSVTAIRMINRARKSLGLKISIRNLFERQTISALIGAQGAAETSVPAPAPLLKMSPGVETAPLFCVHGGTGDASFYAKLASQVGSGAAVHAIQYPAMAPGGATYSSVAELAREYVTLIKGVQPEGPYRLLGWSFGGLAVYEMARQLRARGEEVSMLVMFDALIASGTPPSEKWNDLEALHYMVKVNDLLKHVDDIADIERADIASLDRDLLLERALELLKARQIVPENAGREDLLRNLAAIKDVIYMSMHYRPGAYDGDVVYVGAMDDNHNVAEMVSNWRALVQGKLDLVTVDMRHNRMFDDVHLPEIGAIVRKALAQAEKCELA